VAEVRARPKGGGGEGEEGRICTDGAVDIVDHLGILIMLFYLHVVLCTIDYGSVDDYQVQQGGSVQPAAAGAGPEHARAAFHAETTG
jgi:hypothetical protein